MATVFQASTDSPSGVGRNNRKANNSGPKTSPTFWYSARSLVDAVFTKTASGLLVSSGLFPRPCVLWDIANIRMMEGKFIGAFQ